MANKVWLILDIIHPYRATNCPHHPPIICVSVRKEHLDLRTWRSGTKLPLYLISEANVSRDQDNFYFGAKDEKGSV